MSSAPAYGAAPLAAAPPPVRSGGRRGPRKAPGWPALSPPREFGAVQESGEASRCRSGLFPSRTEAAF